MRNSGRDLLASVALAAETRDLDGIIAAIRIPIHNRRATVTSFARSRNS
jgi:hypothetical protein